MLVSRKGLLTPIRRLTFASITVAAIGLFYFDSVPQSPTAEQQHHMQVGQYPTSKPTNRPMTQKPVTTATVTIQGFQFQPDNVILKKGGKVTFVNKDTAPHTATPNRGAKFTGTGRLIKNQSKSVVFGTVGVQNYFCEIHPSMKGKIAVVN